MRRGLGDVLCIFMCKVGYNCHAVQIELFKESKTKVKLLILNQLQLSQLVVAVHSVLSLSLSEDYDILLCITCVHRPPEEMENCLLQVCICIGKIDQIVCPCCILIIVEEA